MNQIMNNTHGGEWDKMFKCKQCKRQTEEGETQFKRKKYEILKDNKGRIIGKNIAYEKEVCCTCYNKSGEIIKK